MPIIVACPSCSGQLRVADNLIGRKVRCPACSTTFDAQPASQAKPPPINDPPLQTEKVDGWKFLSLELSDDPDPKSPAASRKPIELDSNESIPIPPTPLDPPARRSEPRPSLKDDHDDVAPCPSCGRLAHRDLKRCTHCGERFDGRNEEEDEDRPRRRRRMERRDTEPHRGGFVLAMGIVSLALLTMCPWLSIIPGLIAWICGQGDLRKMRENTMDPEGEGTTQAGWICGMIGTGLGALVILLCSGWMGFLFYMENQNSRNRARPPFVAPVPPPRAPGMAPGQNQ